jgi:predicted ArsR family transcriptional regulator
MCVDEQLAKLAVLGEPTRRAIYRHVLASPGEVSRDEAARAAGVSRKLAAFHLERLLDAGLVEAVYRRLTGRSGPGAGRPAKLYRPSSQPVEVSLPERRYDLAATILAGAEPDRDTVRRKAREYGRAIGRKVHGHAGLLRSLAEHGFRPVVEDGVVRLRSCPFDALVSDHRDLVCEMNLALLTGVRDASGASSLRPELEPAPGRCCVVFR